MLLTGFLPAGLLADDGHSICAGAISSERDEADAAGVIVLNQS